jgi:hypothetical protein
MRHGLVTFYVIEKFDSPKLLSVILATGGKQINKHRN